MKVITNHHRREVLDGFQLTSRERSNFEYLDWDAIDAGEDSASFARYRGELYDLAEFEAFHGFTHSAFRGWDGIKNDTFFSGIIVRIGMDDGGQYVIVGRYYS